MIRLTIAVIFVFFSCACSADNKAVEVKNISTESNLSPALITQLADDKSSSNEDAAIISIEETGSSCNLCSSYKLFVFPNGKARFEGENFTRNKAVENQDYVKEKKVINKQISKKQLEKLIQEFENIKFFELSDKYIPEVNCPENWSDAPTIHIYYKTEIQSKTIHYYEGCEGSNDVEKLKELKQIIDKLFNTTSWLNKSILANTNTLPNQ